MNWINFVHNFFLWGLLLFVLLLLVYLQRSFLRKMNFIKYIKMFRKKSWEFIYKKNKSKKLSSTTHRQHFSYFFFAFLASFSMPRKLSVTNKLFKFVAKEIGCTKFKFYYLEREKYLGVKSIWKTLLQRTYRTSEQL